MIKTFGYSLKQAIKQFFRNRGMSLASLFSITAMLFILGLFFFLTVNVSYLTETIKGQFDTIEVFLLDETTPADAQVMAESLLAMDEVAAVDYISKDQAMEEFKLNWGENAYLLDGLPDNPLPNSLRVQLDSLEGGDMVAQVCRNLIGVEDVRYYKTEIEKVVSIADTIRRAALVIIGVLVIISIVVVSNTVKLTVMARQKEISIMKYVGATNWFIRGPLLMEGIFLGLLSAGIAIGLCAVLYNKFVEVASPQVYTLFNARLVEPGFMIGNLIWIFLALGISIGACGSIISMRRFLKA
jgi:cell division transport system permease protein